jgi:rubrerythrin
MIHKQNNAAVLSRRMLVRGATLSGAAIALLAGAPRLAGPAGAQMMGSMDDVRILNTALSLEHEAIAAYQLGAESGLLQKPVLDVAVTFQGHHKEHRDLLAATVKKLGGTPVDAKPSYMFPADQLKTQADVLRFAAGLEKAAASAYLGAVPIFQNRDLAKASASILGDEAMHWAVLRQALGENPVPAAFIS